MLWYEFRMSFHCIINLYNSIWHAINMRINRVENTPDRPRISCMRPHQECVWVIFQICSLKRFEFEFFVFCFLRGMKQVRKHMFRQPNHLHWLIRFCISNAQHRKAEEANKEEQTFDFLSNAGKCQIMNWATRKVFVCSFVFVWNHLNFHRTPFRKAKKWRSINNSVCQMELKWHDKKTLAPLWSSLPLSSSSLLQSPYHYARKMSLFDGALWMHGTSQQFPLFIHFECVHMRCLSFAY